MNNIRINGERLWQSLMTMAQIGATDKGGCCRLALTELDKQGRDLFIRWCREAGCSIKIDRMGNIFARRPGRDNMLAPVMTGSHLDTQPTGGKFDGVYGVLAGLEVVRTLNDYQVETDTPIELAVWTNEEGSRFAPSMIGSGVFAGVFDLNYGHSRRDLDGATLGDALKAIDYCGPESCGGREIRAFFEVHIEQGPILEAQRKTIGVVTGAQGQYWYDIVVTGSEAHAGTTPMNRRKDALLGSSRLVIACNAIALQNAPYAVATVGMLQVSPNSRNTIPGQVRFSVDFRHPKAEVLAQMDEALRYAGKREEDAGLEVNIDRIWNSPPIVFNADCVAAVRQGAEQAGFEHMPIVSGAGHDACYISRVAPAAMIFVPCADGISHNEIESALPEDLTAGCTVLLHAMLEKAHA